MTCVIEICNLRNIKKLRFTVPDRGVWLLTAGNGAGKTSLLACLRRIGHSNAFPTHFPSSLKSDRLDNHSKGTVTYEINGDLVEYAYRGERWTPRPRSNSHLFSKLGYSSVTYIGATADRITPRPEDFDTRHVKSVNKSIIEAANDIFETQKFSQLRTINLSRGVGNDAFVLSLDGSPPTYHSEKHFSLGELCVLKLLKLIKDVNNNSMIIVDELEMALHPRAQIKMLRFLEKQAAEKSLTIIFSTHSVTLLKVINRKKIIYLEKQDDGEIKTIVGCFPTYAIGNIASDEETLPDILIYVEDVFAREMMTAFFEKFADDKFSEPTERPTAKFVPVGGFNEVIAFLDRNRAVLPATVRQKAVLDLDFAQETIALSKKNENHGQLAKIKKMKDEIDYLPFTPETALCDYVFKNKEKFENNLRNKFNDNQIRIHDIIIIKYDDALGGSARRSLAKKVVDELIDYLELKTQNSADSIRDKLSAAFVSETWGAHKAHFMRLFGSMV